MASRIITLLLMVALILALAACRPDGNNDPGGAPSAPGDPGAQNTPGDPEASVPPSPLPGVNAANYPRIDGSTANLPLIAALYSKFCGVSRDEAETLVSISGGTGAVWRNMMYEGADLLLVYEAPENIKEEMKEAGLFDKLEITPLGRDGLVFLVNANNPVDNLSREQLVGIYSGAITDWSVVGGEEGPIAAFQRNQESGSQTLFIGLLMKDIAPMEPPSELRPASMGGLIDAIAAYDGSGGAIGFSVFYYANLMYENPSLKILSVDGITPSAESIGNKKYPLVNDFYAVIRKSEPADSPARLLRDWLLTEEGRQLMLEENYVPAD